MHTAQQLGSDVGFPLPRKGLAAKCTQPYPTWIGTGGWAKKKQRLVDTFSKESDGASHTSYWWPLGPGTSCGRITFWRIELIKWLCRGIFSFPITCSIASTYSALAIFWDKNLLKMLKQCIVLSGPTLFCKSALIFRVSILPLCVAFSEALHL
jgi:hypothetical protein